MISQINVVIPKLSHYTIVLKMRGGVDKKLIQMFGLIVRSKHIYFPFGINPNEAKKISG